MAAKDPVKTCSTCPLCKFTRNSKKETFFYKIGRAIQRLCPDCKAANEKLDKDFQKSLYA